MNFSSYINGESVRNQDLVNWVTVGAFDVPTSESAPLTSINGRSLSFWLLPYNYFDQVHLLPCTHPMPGMRTLHSGLVSILEDRYTQALIICTCDVCGLVHGAASPR